MAVFGRSHYVANAGQRGRLDHELARLVNAGSAGGPFLRNSQTRAADVSDGLSHTVFVGEHTSFNDKTWVGVVPGSNQIDENPTLYPPEDGGWDEAGAAVLCHSGPSLEDSPAPVIHPPSYPLNMCCQMFGPWSNRGGNVLFGDGHVTFVSATIDLNTWAALSSMKAGDSPGTYDDNN